MPRIHRRTFLATAGAVAAQAAQVDAATSPASGFAVTGLMAEQVERPLGLEVSRPRLSWRVESPARGARQGAYRITAASRPDLLQRGGADLWDSGRVASAASFEISYGGRALRSGERVWWRVQAWDGEGRAQAISEPSWFEMGLLSPADWTAPWIGVEDASEAEDRAAGVEWVWGDDVLDPAPQKFRLAFDAPAGSQAEVLLAGKDHLLGVWLNGAPLPVPEKIFWGVMTTWRVSLQPGANVLAVEARADPPGFFPADGGALAGFLRIRTPDGSLRRLNPAAEWRSAKTDAPGWMAPRFDDSAWPRAARSKSRARNEPWPPVPAMLLRRQFAVSAPIARARLYATALGAYQARINGQPVSEARLAPEISNAADHVLYQAYDVTPLVRRGENVLGVVVGDGWYASAFGWRNERFGFGPGPRRFRAQLVLDHADGTRQVVGTGPDWRQATSPIVSSEIYNGEVFDARLRRPGWDAPGFTGADEWIPAAVAEAPAARLVAQVSPPIREIQTLQPIKVTKPRPGVHVFDFGQNFAGWCRLKVKGPRGGTVQLRFGEVLARDGSVDQANLRGAKATDTYTLAGDPDGETFEPHFTYHGFRYVEATGLPGAPEAGTLTGVVVHSDCPPTGALRLANPLAQQIWSNALWSQRSNFFAVPTDCPQRDERMGWMGDIQVFLDAAAFNMDVDAFIRRFLMEVRAGQTADGAYPIVTPQPLSFPDEVTAGWSEAGIILPWTLWRRYGDTRVIEDNWPAMERWMAYVGEANPDFVWRKKRGLDLGDWLSVDAVKPDDETTPRALCATAYWAYVAELMADMARATGRGAEVARYTGIRRKIGRAYAAEFIRPGGLAGNGSQTSSVLSLRFGLVPAGDRQAVADRLAADIVRRGVKLSTGFLGTPYLLDVLADHGHADLAVSLLLQTGYPSWGYMISKGATTMWERWNGDVGDLSMNSYNHYAFGAVVGFMYRRLAGLAPSAPGFSKLEVRPLYDPRIGAVRAEYLSRLGRVASAVDGDAHGLTRLALTVPANATAEVVLPSRAAWREGGRALQGRGDVKVLQVEPAGVRVAVGSGSYVFTAV